MLRKEPAGITDFNGVNIDITSYPYLISDPIDMKIHKKVLFNTKKKLNICSDSTSAHSQNVKKRPELLSKEKSKEYKYEVFHTNAQTLWSSKPTKTQNIKKVIFTTSGYMKPFYDDGKIGISEVCAYIPVSTKKEANAIIKYLNSALIQYIVMTGKWSGFLNGNVIKAIPEYNSDIPVTEESIYKYFNLTQKEVKHIESR